MSIVRIAAGRLKRSALAVCAAFALALTAPPATAQVLSELPCGVPTTLVQHNPPLTRVARALDARKLRIVVWGTRSSVGGATSGAGRAFPDQLRVLLAEHYPRTSVRIETVVQPGETAAQMLRQLNGKVLALKPDLVIWQTGSVDAARNVSLQEFGRAVSHGLHALRDGDTDVMLMDMQYGPHADLLADFDSHRGYLWSVSRREEVGLLPRYQIMELWSEQGRFDLATDNPAQQRANADAIHACLGELLEWMIVDAAERARNGAGRGLR
jgi:acyl-CoA thioesterase I